jgi:hypothetical protein
VHASPGRRDTRPGPLASNDFKAPLVSGPPWKGVPEGVKWVSRCAMGVALVNLVASIWFAQYIITGWLIALYVLGSFGLAVVSMLFAE